MPNPWRITGYLAVINGLYLALVNLGILSPVRPIDSYVSQDGARMFSVHGTILLGALAGFANILVGICLTKQLRWATVTIIPLALVGLWLYQGAFSGPVGVLLGFVLQLSTLLFAAGAMLKRTGAK